MIATRRDPGLAGLALIVYLTSASTTGSLNLRENVKAAWANIDVLLKQRHDELPKLVDTCKRYMQFEQETLEKVMRARASVSQASTVGQCRRRRRGGAAAARRRSGGLFAVAENYPQLKSDETFKQLQGRIIALEESIADRRELYNDQVNLNNIRVKVFPGRDHRPEIRFPAGAVAGIRRAKKNATSTSARCSALSPNLELTGHVRQSIQILGSWLPVSSRRPCIRFGTRSRRGAKNRVIEDTPTSRVRSAAQGYVELSGLRRAAAEFRQ